MSAIYKVYVRKKEIIEVIYSMYKRILFLVPYPLHESPSQRFRFEQYFDSLKNQKYSYTVQTFLDKNQWRVFFKPGNIPIKMIIVIKGICKRIIALLKSPMYDFIFIHREAAPVGPPLFEWLLAKVFRRKIIYDFDDAIWLTDRKKESWVLRIAKWRTKVSSICRWSYKVSCGNAYLCDYAAAYAGKVVYNPTTIDAERVHNPCLYNGLTFETRKVTIGWTGSHSTLKYLKEIEQVLSKILNDHSNVEFMVIADQRPTLPSLPSIKFIAWNPVSEIQDLMNIDIGIMPLPDDEWAKGKCGFKALQYMALGLPAVASPVGVNTSIIKDGENGFLCNTPDGWELALKKLIQDPDLRKKMGQHGRATVVENYSVVSNTSNFLALFE